MTSKEKIIDIRYLIMEHYNDKQPLEDYQKASRNCFFRYCDEIKQDLERLEKLEKVVKKLEFENNALKLGIDLDLSAKLFSKNKKLKQAIEILKSKIELPLENDFDVVNKDDIHLYRLRIKCLINEEEYELLKEVLENEIS